jgi:hypothetical protein
LVPSRSAGPFAVPATLQPSVTRPAAALQAGSVLCSSPLLSTAQPQQGAGGRGLAEPAATASVARPAGRIRGGTSVPRPWRREPGVRHGTPLARHVLPSRFWPAHSATPRAVVSNQRFGSREGMFITHADTKVIRRTSPVRWFWKTRRNSAIDLTRVRRAVGMGGESGPVTPARTHRGEGSGPPKQRRSSQLNLDGPQGRLGLRPRVQVPWLRAAARPGHPGEICGEACASRSAGWVHLLQAKILRSECSHT